MTPPSRRKGPGRKGAEFLGPGTFRAEHVVLAAGAWSGSLAGKLGLRLPVVPIKGESLAVYPRRELFERTLFSEGCYLVPKADGRVIVGATERAGDFSGVGDNGRNSPADVKRSVWSRNWRTARLSAPGPAFVPVPPTAFLISAGSANTETCSSPPAISATAFCSVPLPASGSPN